MTIRTIRPNRGQHYRPRMHCLQKIEAHMVEMQDPKSGLKGAEQKLNVTTIPHVITGQDIIAWLLNKMKVTQEEAEAYGTMLVAYGYIYPLQNHRKLVMCNDGSLYRFQTPYFWPTQKWVAEDCDYAIYLAKRNIRKKGVLEPFEQEHYTHLHTWLNHKWDFIVMQATEQYKAGKERKKPDRVVLDCQERAYWIVNRPPTKMQCLGVQGFCNDSRKPFFFQNIFYQQAIMRSKVKSSVSLGALVKFVNTYKNHDPFLAPCLPSNPWVTDNDTYWTLNIRRVDQCTKMRVERWSFSFFELLSDQRGRDDFKSFLKKEFSGGSRVCVCVTFLAPGAPRWINIDGRTMGLTVKGLDHPHRYVLDGAQTHVFLLMKKVPLNGVPLKTAERGPLKTAERGPLRPLNGVPCDR
uniref:DEP domain-containing protein n=1 Tax=Gadus morhua TaxID=8049 RepID=A0A8C5BFW4_GADMO